MKCNTVQSLTDPGMNRLATKDAYGIPKIFTNTGLVLSNIK